MGGWHPLPKDEGRFFRTVFHANPAARENQNAAGQPPRLISLPSAALPARSDALLCYLENKYQVTRPNRHKDGHEETLNLLIRLCFRDD